MKKNKLTSSFTLGLFSFICFFFFWFILSDNDSDNVYSVLPSPVIVIKLLFSELKSGELSFHLGHTLYRVLWSFIIALICGTIIGFFMGRSKSVDDFLDVWIIVFMNLPALVLIVLCYIWIGLNDMAAIIAVALNKIPLVAVLVRQGARELDPKYSDIAKVFQLTHWSKIRHIFIPQMFPYVISAARSGLSIIWKIVLVVEFLGRPNGIGFQIHLYFQLFDVGMVLAYAVSFIIIMLIVEIGVLRSIEKHSYVWKID